ncbi:MAG: hypothetical protein VX589_12310 [Myxococcota bacterium]|nr:hypothetical protein [Myxococcota bacterium]
MNAALRDRAISQADARLHSTQPGHPTNYQFQWTGERLLTVSQGKKERASWSETTGQSGELALLPPVPVLNAMANLFTTHDIKPWLTDYGVAATRQRLVLLDDRVCLVTGSDKPGQDAPQIWIEQITFLPRRFMFNMGSRRVSIALNDWHGPVTMGRFPYVIEIRLDGRPVFKLTTSTVYPVGSRGEVP